eukprot:875820_1
MTDPDVTMSHRRIVLESTIDLGQLSLISVDPSLEDFRCPPNSVLFFFKHGVFADPRLASVVSRTSDLSKQDVMLSSPTRNHSNTFDLDRLFYHAKKLSELRTRLKNCLTERDRNESKLNRVLLQLGEKDEKCSKLYLWENQLSRVEILCDEASLDIQHHVSDCERICADVLPVAFRLLEIYGHVSQKHSLLQSTNKQQINLKSELSLTQHRLHLRRRKLMHQLSSLYPIQIIQKPRPMTHSSTHGSTHEYQQAPIGVRPEISIRGMVLPLNNVYSLGDEKASAAMGYIAHIVLLISKFLGVSIRYRIIYRCSASTICDDTHHPELSTEEYPLYTRGVDRARFEQACVLIRKNVWQILSVRGVKDSGFPSHILHNLHCLFEYETKVPC